MTIGSLFSGIGGLELGLERAGLGPVVWQVEIDPFCRLVLEKHWPDAKRFNDVRTVTAAELAPVDIICGGFPCQDVSGAGRRKGLTGSRSGLWSEFARIVSELLPEWVVIENVTSGASRWFDTVVCELDGLGYDCLPVPLSANDVGAPHLRKRIFIVANCRRVDRILQPGGRKRAVWSEALRVAGSGAQWSVANDLHEGREGSGPSSHEGRQGPVVGSWGTPKPGVGSVVPRLPGGLAGGQRRRRIRALGNAVVPQCAEVVGWVVRELIAAQQLAANCGGAP